MLFNFCLIFTHDIIEITNEVNTSYFPSELDIFPISKFRFKKLEFILSFITPTFTDISLNTGPFSNSQLFKEEEWQAFRNIGLHLIHLKLNKP